jgi:acyl-CoA thioester hydrolase
MEPNNLGPILARAHCDYKKQIHYPDTIQVSARIERLGNTSMTMHHELVSEKNDELAAVGSSVVVLFNYKSQKPVRIPERIRDTIRKFESDANL